MRIRDGELSVPLQLEIVDHPRRAFELIRNDRADVYSVACRVLRNILAHPPDLANDVSIAKNPEEPITTLKLSKYFEVAPVMFKCSNNRHSCFSFQLSSNEY